MIKYLFHPRIHPANYPILARYDAQHPAVRALQIHAESRDVCVGKEIDWPHIGNKAIEQAWDSRLQNKRVLFSALAYEFISFDLVLDGWLTMAPEPTNSEAGYLSKYLPVMLELLQECEEAASVDQNEDILPLIVKARDFVVAYRDATLHRFSQCGIRWAGNVD